MRRAAAATILLFGLLAGVAAPQAPAAEEPRPGLFLLLNQERILTDSTRGQALLALEEAERERLRGEARAIETAFEEEERRLTEQRAELAPEEFRALADDFDARVVQARQDQDAKAAALAAEFDQRRRAFYADVAPILVRVMEGFGASAILDETTVLLADQKLNITDEVIAEIDRAFPQEGADEEGARMPAPGPEQAPAEAPPVPGTAE